MTNPLAYQTRFAVPQDCNEILALLPRLADFDLPPRREPEVFWHGDADLLRDWADGNASATFVRVAVGQDDTIVAAAIVTMGEDGFTRHSNAHLEVIVVAPLADGNGLGRQLIRESQDEARSRGALSMSLHVMGNNSRARGVYAKLGFHEEMIRAIAFLDSDDQADG